jgi:NitT/TauT family transport system ATP-binding protein
MTLTPQRQSGSALIQSSTGSASIRIQQLDRVFRARNESVQALRDVNLSIGQGEFCCIVGPSGCGKTTLLRILAGLDTHTAGRLELHQRDPSKPLTSMVFQEQSVFPWMTVRDNISYGLRMRNVPKQTWEPVVDYYIDRTGLRKFANSYPFQLSGGMKQRVSVARAFANDPEILLMDEPFANLDEQNRILLQEELLRIWEDSKNTVVFITHSIDEAIVLGDRVVVMTAHPGTIKVEMSVDFPRPRAVYELKANPAFGEMAFAVWSQLRDEVLKSKDEEVKQA